MQVTIGLILSAPLACLVFARCILVLSKHDGWLHAIVATSPVPCALALVFMPSAHLPFPGFAYVCIAVMTALQFARLFPQRPLFTPIKPRQTDARKTFDARR